MSYFAKTVAAFLLLIGALQMGGCIAFISNSTEPTYVATRQLTVPHEEGSGLAVISRNGSITVKATTGTDVVIEARLKCTSEQRLAETTIAANRENGKLKIEVVWAGGRQENNESCSFDIAVPDTKGIELQTTNGGITVSGLAGGVVARTHNGSVTVTDHNGTTDVSSTNGRLVVRNVGSSVIAHTTNGGIEVYNAKQQVNAGTTNGRVVVELAPEAAGPLKINTTNGAVELTVGQSFAGKLDLSTTNGGMEIGDLKNARLISMQKHSATLSFGDATTLAASEVHTTNGSVRLRPAVVTP